jgi:hypothetical protein
MTLIFKIIELNDIFDQGTMYNTINITYNTFHLNLIIIVVIFALAIF